MVSDEKTVRDGFLSSIVNQISTNDPPEARQTYDRLRADGRTDTEALQLMGLVLKNEMQKMISESRGFSNERYISLLEKLPDIEE
ncbi:MAG: hypothetical protein ACM3X5_00770 [Bacillota bacterium]